MTLTKEKALAHLEIQIFHFFNPTYCTCMCIKLVFIAYPNNLTKLHETIKKKVSTDSIGGT